MTRYTADSRDRVFDAVDMVALVSDRTELTRRGVDSYFGLCPFHDERTGSFHVRPDEKHYHCFGCQASGDPFRFVMETQGLDFKAALEVLADRFGVTLETEAEDPAAASRRQRRERLHALLDRTAIYYARYLWEAGDRGAAAARDYLRGRGLEESTLREFRVGYAPSAWDRILLASRRAGYSDEELLAVGLGSRSRSSPGQIFDRFRDRIMFPAVDARGRVLGFGARRMRENQDPAKYLNTAEGELYHKREVLFGIDLARAAAARAGRMILVEGYTDVLALHQADIRNTVGIMGTSLTEEQVSELERVVPALELCLDADRAGQEAMVRAARLAAGHKLELRVVSMPEGTDPADLVEREGADAVRERVRGSVPFVAFNVERILARADTDTAEGRDRALAELGPVLEEVPPSVLRDDLVRRVAGRLELSEARLATLGRGVGGRSGGGGRSGVGGRSGGGGGRGGAGGVGVSGGAGGQGWRANGSGQSHTAGPGPSGAGGAVGVTAPTASPAVRSERLFLGLCLAVPDLGDRTLAEIDVDRLLTGGAMRRAARHLAGRARRPLSELPPEDEELARVIADLVTLAGRIPDPSPDRLEHARLLLELERLERAIIRARGEGAGTNELAVQREAVRDRLHEVGARLEETL